MKKISTEKYALLVLRLGMAVVFFWFGVSQLIHPSQWTRFMPDILSALPFAKSIILVNGSLEIIGAVLLSIGLFTRFVALLLGIHLLGIIFSLGYGATAVRDFGLMVAMFTLALSETFPYSYDEKYAQEGKEETMVLGE